MRTEFIKPDINNCNYAMEKAAEILRNEGLVAFPTETVYGLGANALSPAAVKKIFLAKGRPSDNPLIIHVADINMLKELTAEIPPQAELALKHFCPGPLTLVLKKSKSVPYEVTAGLETVALRIPKNPWAQLLIKTAGLPIAAPSANSSGKPSPTRASHVLYDLDGKIDMILDGGACEEGIESTIVDFSTDKPCILRPGTVTAEMLKSVGIRLFESKPGGHAPKAPGMKYTHYKPKAQITVIKGEPSAVSEKIRLLVSQSTKPTGILCSEQNQHLYQNINVPVIVAGDTDKPHTIASNLYKLLRRFDKEGIETVFSESFHDNPLGIAIMNRLNKAAGGSIIEI